MKKYSLRILFVLVTVAALVLAVSVNRNPPVYSVTAVSPNGKYTFTSTITKHNSTKSGQIEIDSTMTRNSDGLICLKQIEFYADEIPPPTPEKEPTWSKDSETPKYWVNDYHQRRLGIKTSEFSGLPSTSYRPSSHKLKELLLDHVGSFTEKSIRIKRTQSDWTVYLFPHSPPPVLIIDDDGNLQELHHGHGSL